MAKQTDDIWVGVDLGGTKMLAQVFDDQFDTLGKKRRRTKGYEGQKIGVERIIATVLKALEESGEEKDRVAGIGMGIPGPLDLEKGIIINTPNLGWKNVPIVKELKRAIGVPVVIGNDVDMGVYGEFIKGAGRKGRCVLGVFPGTGIGGGLVYEGKVFRGKVSSCLEFGHIQVQPDGPLCGCGKRGCLEAVASRLAISSQCAAAAFRGEAPRLLELAGTDLASIRSGVLAKAVQEGDEAVESIIKDAASWLGVGVAGVVNLLAPDIVVLGGGLVEAMPKLYLETVEKAARKRAMDSFKDCFEVKVAELGDDATVLGAAAWAKSCAAGA